MVFWEVHLLQLLLDQMSGDIATSVNAVFDSTGVTAIASTQLKLQAKTLYSTYNGQTSISFSIQGKNTTATTIAANVTLSNNEGSSVLSELRDSINNYTTTTGVTATLSTDKSSIIMVQNEGYDIKLGDVNFAGDTTTSGARRTLLVTSLDNDEIVAGDAVSLGDTNITTTDDRMVYSCDPGGAYNYWNWVVQWFQFNRSSQTWNKHNIH